MFPAAPPKRLMYLSFVEPIIDLVRQLLPWFSSDSNVSVTHEQSGHSKSGPKSKISLI